MIIAFLILISLLLPLPVMAESAEQNSNSGKVQLTVDGDVVYLSTTTNDASDDKQTSDDESIDQVEKNPSSALSEQEIQLPQGFAQDFSQFMNSVLSLVMIISALLVFLVLILASFQWITSGGDKGKTDAARNRMTSAVIGIIIVSASYAVLTLVLRFLGFADINDVFNHMQTIN